MRPIVSTSAKAIRLHSPHGATGRASASPGIPTPTLQLQTLTQLTLAGLFSQLTRTKRLPELPATSTPTPSTLLSSLQSPIPATLPLRPLAATLSSASVPSALVSATGLPILPAAARLGQSSLPAQREPSLHQAHLSLPSTPPPLTTTKRSLRMATRTNGPT